MSAVVEKLKVDLEHGCWTAEYLLAHCEGYRVESNEGKLGYVEEVVWAPDGSEPLALRVRTGFDERGLITIMIEGVLELHPNGELIVVRAPTGRTEPLETNGSSARPKERASIPGRESRSAPAVEFSAR